MICASRCYVKNRSLYSTKTTATIQVRATRPRIDLSISVSPVRCEQDSEADLEYRLGIRKGMGKPAPRCIFPFNGKLFVTWRTVGMPRFFGKFSILFSLVKGLKYVCQLSSSIIIRNNLRLYGYLSIDRFSVTQIESISCFVLLLLIDTSYL